MGLAGSTQSRAALPHTHLTRRYLIAQPNAGLGQQPLKQGPAGQEPGKGQEQLAATLGAILGELSQPGVAL